jgi:hypothetical protein
VLRWEGRARRFLLVWCRLVLLLRRLLSLRTTCVCRSVVMVRSCEVVTDGDFETTIAQPHHLMELMVDFMYWVRDSSCPPLLITQVAIPNIQHTGPYLAPSVTYLCRSLVAVRRSLFALRFSNDSAFAIVSRTTPDSFLIHRSAFFRPSYTSQRSTSLAQSASPSNQSARHEQSHLRLSRPHHSTCFLDHRLHRPRSSARYVPLNCIIDLNPPLTGFKRAMLLRK